MEWLGNTGDLLGSTGYLQEWTIDLLGWIWDLIDFKNVEVDKLEKVDRKLLKRIGASRSRMKWKNQQLKTYYQPNI